MSQREEAIFLEAISRPTAQRAAYVEEACGDDAALRQRLLELLAAHEDSEDQFLEKRPPGVGEALIPETIDAEPNTPRKQMAVQPKSSPAAKSAFAESTRSLLRTRLTIASIILLGLEASFIAIALTTRPSIFDLSLRCSVFTGLVFLLLRLRQNTEFSISTLRRIELGLIAVPMIEIIAFLVYHTEELAASGQFEDISILRLLVAMGSCVVISLYGMFIPSHWKRTALVVGAFACLPTIAILIHTWLNPTLQSAEVVRKDIAIRGFLLTGVIAVIATLGAHVVHQIRRQVAAAKQYGQYELVRQIGSGGMGVVYEAKHRMLKRPAAIKLIRSEAADDDRMIENFEREVQISATLSHWNTVQIFDYGRSDDGEFFYVMELLNGRALNDYIRTNRMLTVHATINIVKQICAGLEEAHAIGMVHRDLKPANVFLAEYGGHRNVIKILDFGLAVHASVNPQETVSGTPNYMSPEQVLGEGIDGRSDIYAIGCILFECLSGTPPFLEFNTDRVLNKQLIASPPMQEIPKSAQVLSPIIAKCLAKNRNDRFVDVASLKQALNKVEAGGQVNEL